MDVAKAREITSSTIDDLDSQLRELNNEIHSHPELGFEEIFAHEKLTTFLSSLGFNVTRQAHGLSTAFEAEIGSEGRCVVICAEYDALPKIGHACGHNLIATSSIAAFVGAAAVVHKLGIVGKIRILGTPAEEGGGGKAKLIENGAFDGDIAAAIMAHPFSAHQIEEGYSGIAGFNTIAAHKLRVEFRGKNAHAGGEPWNGLNALDAAVSAYNNISMLRQQIRPRERMQGIIEVGGVAPNVITDYTRMHWGFRSPTIQSADALLARAKNCFEAAAQATGCAVNYIPAPSYMDLRANNTLCKTYIAEMESLGERVLLLSDTPVSGGTDMGNVSHKVPSFHGSFGIPTAPGVPMHHPEFAQAASTDAAHTAAVKCGKGMAMLALRVLTDEAVATSARADFDTKEEPKEDI